MKYLDLTFSTPAANLACDEALLDFTAGEAELLRFWEPATPFAVLGYGNQADCEVNLDLCRRAQVPVLRRCTGGGTVLQALGCLNYSLLFRIPENGPLSSVTGTNRFVMERHRDVFRSLLGRDDVQVQGHTDLTLAERKFSGNAQRRKRGRVLFHGSILLQLDLAMLDELLPLPSKEPSYRAHRVHTGFLMNLCLPAARIKKALTTVWDANELFMDCPWSAIQQLVQDKYSLDPWNLRC